MDIAVYFGIFLLGLSAGSFLNALVFRLGTAESILWGRSHCQTCQHTLEWHELIPLASFAILGGKCKACHAPISFQYPIVELLTALTFSLIYISYKNTISFASPFAVLGGLPLQAGLANIFGYAFGLIFYFIVAALLLGIGIYDFRTKIIAPALIAPFFILALIGLALQWFSGASLAGIAATVIAALLVLAFFAGLWVFSKGRAMGFGDAELASTIVLFLGSGYGLLALLLAFWLGAIFGLFLIAAGRAHLKSAIPFGPFLVAGAFIALLWGEAMLRTYFAIFL